MSSKGTAVFGVYATHASAEAAVDALRATGFRSNDISVVLPQRAASTDFTSETATTEGASAGPGASSAIGGTLGWLVGMSALAIAGSVFVVAGPIMTVLANMGQTVGGIASALTGFGVPEEDAKRYESHVSAGGILLSVHSDDPDWTSKGRHVLEQTGAQEIASTGGAQAKPEIVHEVAHVE
jgi:hypothetical protein